MAIGKGVQSQDNLISSTLSVGSQYYSSHHSYKAMSLSRQNPQWVSQEQQREEVWKRQTSPLLHKVVNVEEKKGIIICLLWGQPSGAQNWLLALLSLKGPW